MVRFREPSAVALVALGVLLGTHVSTSDETNDLRPAADRLSPLPVAAVTIRDGFWAPRLEVNRTRTLDHVLKEIESTGGLSNFDIAAGKATGKFGGPFWADSDVYKWIEGASWTLAKHPDPALDAKVDAIIARIAAAQQPDGYLDTFVQINVPDLKFKNFAFFHEDFSSGHLFEAGVAHYLATGKKTLLTVATRMADVFDREFGPGKKDYIPGHEGIELALVKLSRATGEKRYFELAKAMLDRRGQKPSIFEGQFKQLDANRTVDFLGKPLRIGEWYERFYLKDPKHFDTRYAQDHVPVREQKEAVGHAVRAMFLYCAMADVVHETSDPGLWSASKALHDSVTLHRMYVTGGIGPSEHNEGFTADYDLPNENAYQETCASAAMVLWNHRLLNVTGDAKYTDVMEQSLYNAVAAGVSLTGDLFCYATPLASRGDVHALALVRRALLSDDDRPLPAIARPVRLQPFLGWAVGEPVHRQRGDDRARLRQGHAAADHEVPVGRRRDDRRPARRAARVHAARPPAGLGGEPDAARQRRRRLAAGRARLRRDPPLVEERRHRPAVAADGRAAPGRAPERAAGAGQDRGPPRSADLRLRAGRQPRAAARRRPPGRRDVPVPCRSHPRRRCRQADDRRPRAAKPPTGTDASTSPPPRPPRSACR